MEKEQIEDIRQNLFEQIESQDLPEESKIKLKEQIENASDEDIEEFVKQQGRGQGQQCIFCGIAEGKIETFKIFENADILAFLDINPASKGHILLIPKKHFQFLFQVPDNIVSNIFLTAKRIMPIIINVTKAEGISIYIAQGIDQHLSHLVVNLIPRFKNDLLRFTWERKKANQEELKEIAHEIRSRIGKEEEEEKNQKEHEEKQKKHEKDEIDYMKKFLRRIP